MAPKKKEQQKMSLGDFLTDSGFGGGSWADEVEETYVGGTQPLPSVDRSRTAGSTSMWQDRGFSVRESAPATLPTKPPFTAHLGNLSYDATQESVTEFFEGCETVSVRIIEDRELMRPKGFGYVEFVTLDGLKKALTLDGESFQGRMIKIKVADPPRGGDPGRGDSIREMGDWSRKGPLDGPPARLGGRQGGDFGERRNSRDPAGEARPTRDFTWERRGPLAPLAPEEGGPRSRDGSRPRRAAPEGMGERSESYRGARQSPAATWGEPRPEGARPRQEPAEIRPERVPTAAEKDNQWRDRMRPEVTPETSTPNSPGASAAPALAQRPKLNLTKRTVSEAPADASSTADSKASPFGAARPIDTAAREKEVEERRQQAIKEKHEADEKAKEERRVAKEAAAAAEAKAKEEAEAAAKKAEEDKANGKVDEVKQEEPPKVATENGATEEKKAPAQPKESPPQPKEAPKPKTFEGNWRSAGGDRSARGPPRGPRGDGARDGGHRGSRDIRNEPRDAREPRGPRHEGRGPRNSGPHSQQQAAPVVGDAESPVKVDSDGWTTVAVGKKGRGGRPVAS